MAPLYTIPGIIVFTVVGTAIFIRIIISPIRGARHLHNVLNPHVDSADKEESKEILKDSATSVSSYLGFMFTVFVLLLAVLLVSLLGLPYIFNLILGVGGAALLYFSYNYFQNRLP